MKPSAIDLYCGLGGWAEGFLSEGYDVVGFDIERHRYPRILRTEGPVKNENEGSWFAIGRPGQTKVSDNPTRKPQFSDEIEEYPGQLVLQDVCSIHGAQFVPILPWLSALVASSPCQEFSYRAMPWKRAKALGPPLLGIKLFWQSFRIQQELYEASGVWIPLVAENVRGAEKWVGPAKWHYGSYYLWGDVPALMPPAFKASKVPGFRFDGSGKSFQTASVQEGRKSVQDGLGGYGGSFGWNDTPMRRGNSRSDSRKAASAQIAKIPFPLAQWIAKVYKPDSLQSANAEKTLPTRRDL